MDTCWAHRLIIPVHDAYVEKGQNQTLQAVLSLAQAVDDLSLTHAATRPLTHPIETTFWPLNILLFQASLMHGWGPHVLLFIPCDAHVLVFLHSIGALHLMEMGRAMQRDGQHKAYLLLIVPPFSCRALHIHAYISKDEYSEKRFLAHAFRRLSVTLQTANANIQSRGMHIMQMGDYAGLLGVRSPFRAHAHSCKRARLALFEAAI